MDTASIVSSTTTNATSVAAKPIDQHALRVLMLSTDASALSPESATFARLASYATRLGSLTVLVVGAEHKSSAKPERGAKEGSAQPVKQGKLSVEALPGLRILRPWAIKRALRARLVDHSFDLVSSQDPFETGLGALWGIRAAAGPRDGKPDVNAASQASLHARVPLHIQVHTDFLSPWYARESFKNRVRLRIADRVLPEAAGIRVVSDRVKRSLLTRYGRRIQEPAVIPLVVPLPDGAAAPLPAHAFTFSLIAVGRIEPEKRIGDLLAALAIVRKTYPRTGLFIAGDGRERKRLASLAARLGVADAVVWLGQRADAVALIGSATAFIQASAYEGYGCTLIEAALMRAPIITTDVGIVGDVLKPEKDAIVVPVGDVPAITQAIARLIEDNRDRSILGSEAAHTARNHLMANMNQPDEVAEDLAKAAARPSSAAPVASSQPHAP